MKTASLALVLGVSLLLGIDGRAAVSPALRLVRQGTNALIETATDSEAEWRFQSSTDLQNWSDVSALGTLLSSVGRTRSGAITNTSGARFYRAVRTAGLYDPAVLRTLQITFAISNWQQRLAANYASASNLVADLTMDGLVYPGVGVRYKGNTSYGSAGQKKSLNIEVDYTHPALRLMGYQSLNLNNASMDSSMMREALYFNSLQEYAVGPKGNFVRLFINGTNWGVYSFAQQVNSDLIDEWFKDNEGDRWKAPSGTGGGGGPGTAGGGGFSSGSRALTYLGDNPSRYKSFYELKSQHSSDPWTNLIHATDVLNRTPTNELRAKVESVLAVDRWLWFLVLENVFADEDSYWFKGADYEIYFEPETGRLHPLEYDGNEALMSSEVRLNPLQGVNDSNRPVISRLLAIPELRQRYLAHMRTVLERTFRPESMNARIDGYRATIEAAVSADTKKTFSMSTFTNAINALKTFVKQRHDFLVAHAELRQIPPVIQSVSAPEHPTSDRPTPILVEVTPQSDQGVDSVWLYYRAGPAGAFIWARMQDDGAHEDGLAGDGRFGAAIETFAAGTTVHYYVEARSTNAAHTAAFAPARAEQDTFKFRVETPVAATSAVVINEVMPANHSLWPDPQGDYDDWIELFNVSAEAVDLSGKYLSDDPKNPRKWKFPPDSRISPRGYLVVWADEDGTADLGWHASFKLSAQGEQVLLVDSDENHNALLDQVSFGLQAEDRSFGRFPDGADHLGWLVPTPVQPNVTP